MTPGTPKPLSLAQLPTPIERLEAPSSRLGVNLFVKRDDLTGGITSGNKVRKLEYSLAQALSEGCDVILSCGATQTNHGRALAALCAQLNLKCQLFLLGDKSDQHLGNHLLTRILGAQINYIDLHQYKDRQKLFHRAKQDWQQKGHKAFIIPTGASDALGSLGYVKAVEEIAQQSSVEFDHVVVAVGSGGTLVGLAVGNAVFEQNWKIHGITVCDNKDYFGQVAEEILDGLKKEYLPELSLCVQDLNFVDGFKGRGYGRSDTRLRRQLIQLAQECGLVLDPVYTMKAWQGLESLVDRSVIRPGENVLFIHTGGTGGLLGHGGNFGIQDFES